MFGKKHYEVKVLIQNDDMTENTYLVLTIYLKALVIAFIF